VLGDLTAMACSLLGLGVLMNTSATLFLAFKWIGAAYLLYLGINLWRVAPDLATSHRQQPNFSRRTLLRSSFVVTALNPKSIAFFVAFLPQFITTGKPVSGQLLLLGGTFLVLALVNAALYALFASRLREAVGKKRVRTWFNRCGGTALIGAGIVTAAMQRTS
jgi:threonine/homoserine/homoserine lactone efflux protein